MEITRKVKRVPRNWQTVPSGGEPVRKQEVRNIVKNVMNATREHKYFGTLYNSTVDNAGTILPICRPAQGTSDSNRVGDTIEYSGQSVVRWAFSTNGGESNLVRIIIFKWMLNDPPGSTDILQPSFISTTQAPLAPINHDNRSHIKVYHDQIQHVQVAQDTDTVFGTHFFKPLGKVNFVSASTSVGSGQIYLLVISDSGAAPSPNFEMGTHVEYTDA